MNNLTRRSALAALAGPCAAGQSRATRRPNFLFILADDHAGYVLGCDGNALASTPNLDRLAAQGTRFTQHYCNSPVCTPSRQSFFTGQLPHAAGVTRLPTPLSPAKPTLAKQFKIAGYATAVFGKMHFNRPGEPGLHGFDYLMTEGELNRAWTKEVKPAALPADVATKPAWRPFKDPARIWLNADALPFPRHEGEMKGSFLVRQAAAYVQELTDRPFALWVSFQEPHSPYDFPIEDAGRYKPSQFSQQRIGPEDASQIPIVFRDLSDRDRLGIQASYYTSVSFLDRSVGRILSALEREGLAENTFVVYMADHGYNLGQHGRFEKHCGYDPALRVPLMMRWPGRIRAGTVNQLTEHADVPATIVDLMGLDPLAVLHGQTLRPYLEGRQPAARDHIFSEYLENEEAYIRTRRWKYIYCSGKRARKDGYETDDPTPGRYERLYDLQQDPGEFRNIAATHANVTAEMKRLLLTRFRRTHPEAEQEPPRLTPEDALDWYLRPRDV